ncbi:MAG: dioxygenase [Burkholderiales bacterium]|nr:dioxygenase [Burkholderiales bacterium]
MRLPTYFISHGGGPWPWMAEREAMYRNLAASLAAMPREFAAARALLVVTAHWEETAFTVQGSARPPMLYDYYGFPAHTYEVVYPAPGDPQLAERVRALVAGAGLPAAIDAVRGFDHGTFTPLAVMRPAADLPVVQVSLKADFDPAEHLALGRALAPLRDAGVVIIGSGLSYHNLRAMGPAARAPSKAFDDWLGAAMAAAPEARERALIDWEQAPAARFAHPREEHLLPLMVAAGAAAGETAARIYHEDDFFGGVSVSSFRFGAVPPA